MIKFLKFGGLAFSAALTVSLFLRLFGFEAYGIIMALAALVLFEGGAIAWNKVTDYAEAGQRPIAYMAMWFCALLSIASSGSEIILATGLFEAPIDINFVTLLMIVGALAVNVLGILAYEQNNPDTAERHRELNRMAKETQAQAAIEDSFTMHAVMQAKAKAKEVAGAIADSVGESIKGKAVKRLTGGVVQYAKDAQEITMLASAGGSQVFTREEVERMIAEALAQQAKRPKAKAPQEQGQG